MKIFTENNIQYSRQIVLPEVGIKGQTALQNLKVLIIGAGGLGHPCIQSLAAAGVGTLSIIDHDVVSASNLPRQFLFNQSDVGEDKVTVVKDKIIQMNPRCSIITLNQIFNQSNAEELIQSCDIVVDCCDNYATKFLINDVCLKLQKPWVYASVTKFEGQWALFDAKNSSCYRCLYPTTPLSHIGNCAEQGVLGSVTSIIGNFQALLVIKWCISKVNSHMPFDETGQIHAYNFLSHDKIKFQVPKNPKCLCRNPQTIEFSHELSSCTNIDMSCTWDYYQNFTKDKILFDIRKIADYNLSHHADAIIFDENFLTKINNTNTLFIYCETGLMSLELCLNLRANGIEAYSLKGGFELLN